MKCNRLGMDLLIDFSTSPYTYSKWGIVIEFGIDTVRLRKEEE